MCLLNVPECAILSQLSEVEYPEAISILQHLILVTDIANHCRQMAMLRQLPGCFDNDNEMHQMQLLGLLMTCSDLNQVTKPLETALYIGDLIYEEFHNQGDREKEKGHTPHPMMDREKCALSAEQIGFINFLAMPAFEVLSEILPETQHLTDKVQSLLSYWQARSLKENQ